MKRSFTLVALAAAIIGVSMSASYAADEKAAAPAALNYTMKDIDGKDVNLATTYSGKVVMMLNVASYCGNTPQYTALEKVYTKYKDKGFVILGFPANNFGAQEPGTDAQIKAFCTAEDSKYHITFPLMSKVSVKGNDIAPLFKYLTTQESKPLSKGDVAWNFEKFIIGKDGKLAARFGNKVQPEDPALIAAIETAVNAK